MDTTTRRREGNFPRCERPADEYGYGYGYGYLRFSASLSSENSEETLVQDQDRNQEDDGDGQAVKARGDSFGFEEVRAYNRESFASSSSETASSSLSTLVNDLPVRGRKDSDAIHAASSHAEGLARRLSPIPDLEPDMRSSRSLTTLFNEPASSTVVSVGSWEDLDGDVSHGSFYHRTHSNSESRTSELINSKIKDSVITTYSSGSKTSVSEEHH